MRKFLIFFACVFLLAACARSPQAGGDHSLVIGFKDRVGRQDAEAVLREIFEGISQEDYELLFEDPRSLEAVREKYPQRSLRAPASEGTEKPLAYKVNVYLSDEKIDRLIADKEKWEEVEFIQRDFQVHAYE